jgi:hypothetical protein
VDGSPLIGETAAKLLDILDESDGEIAAVALVAFVEEDEEGAGTIYVQCSREPLFEQMGLLHAGLRALDRGVSVANDEDDD